MLVFSRGELAENREKVRQHGLTFPVVLQKKSETSKLYAMFATPAAYLIDGEGIITADIATGAPPILNLLDRAGAATCPRVRQRPTGTMPRFRRHRAISPPDGH